VGKRRDSAPARNGDDRHLRYWGLVEPPFLLDPDPRFAYGRDDHREGLARLLFGITQIGGLVLITGEVGAGKTLLAQTIAGALDSEGIRVGVVANPPRTAAALLGESLAAIGVASTGGSAAKRAERIRARLSMAYTQGRRIVLVVDEAQRLDPRALDELRMLTNPEGGVPGMPIVLMGQPELAPLVARQPQVDQRVVVRYHLGPMDADEVDAYVRHRTRVAGVDRRIVSKRATRAVHAETGGLPRPVNMLLASALYVAAERGEDQVSEDTIRDLAEDRRAMGGGAG
jgi:general secretion pathway protein A